MSPPPGWPKTAAEMKIVVVGKGGREHALVRALAESPGSHELFCFPGSDAIFELAKPVPADGLESLVAWMSANAIDLCVAGEDRDRQTGAQAPEPTLHDSSPWFATW